MRIGGIVSRGERIGTAESMQAKSARVKCRLIPLRRRAARFPALLEHGRAAGEAFLSSL